MGKRYYCDYCDKTMSCTMPIIKTHNSGLTHQKLVQEHYQKYKDPATILAEESKKTPCNRYLKGECRFGTICRFSHYSREQIDGLKQYVETKHLAESVVTQLSFQDLYKSLQKERTCVEEAAGAALVDGSGVTHALPWAYSAELERCAELPSSIHKFKLEDFGSCTFSSWG